MSLNEDLIQKMRENGWNPNRIDKAWIEAALLLCEEDICERSDGNPVAINVMCVGVATYGPAFMEWLAAADLRGAAIFRTFKDECGSDLSAFRIRLHPQEAR
jgi:hypothetical protein